MSQKKVYIAPMPDGLTPCHWTEDAIKLINERFLMRDRKKQLLETSEYMCWRTAYQIASAEKKYGKTEEQIIALATEFYNLMAERKFFPNAPTLYNAGTGNGLQYSACYVFPIEDSMEGIYDALKWQALIHKSGGGTGFAFSKLREENATVGSTNSVSSGPIPFLRVYNSSTASVTQGGKRRGANMAIMNVHHPDIMKFVQCKGILDSKNRDLFDEIRPYIFSKAALENFRKSLLASQISNFNISVAATDLFMRAVKEDTEYDLISPKDNQVVGRLRAREVFDLIVKMAWETGDPGLWFIDKTNRSPANPLPEIMYIEATNPCGEQPLFPNDVCNLGSIALVWFLVKEDSRYAIDWTELERVVRLGVRFLDNVIEVNPYPLPQIMKLAHDIRRIGLGVMGWADLLTYLNVPYASNEACKLAEKVQSFINQVGHDESEKLAEERGPFPFWDKSIYRNGKPIRNCTITTIAPTGEISVLAGCSGGIEPSYGLTAKHTSGDRVLTRIFPSFVRFIEVAKEREFYSQTIEDGVRDRGNITGLENVPDDVKEIFVTAHEIKPDWHIKMQAAFQKHTDNGVSKTINLPNSAKLSDIDRAYWTAYETDCLGITVFRDGCKGKAQVLSAGVGEKPKIESKANCVRSRPGKILPAVDIRVETPDGAAYVFIGSDPKAGYREPFELFVSVAKAGTDALADAEAVGRLSSAILRMESRMPLIDRLKLIQDQLKYLGGSRTSGFGKEKISSVPDGVSRAIDEYIEYLGLNDDDGSSFGGKAVLAEGNRCPECHQGTLIYEEGCRGGRCTNCNYSVC